MRRVHCLVALLMMGLAVGFAAKRHYYPPMPEQILSARTVFVDLPKGDQRLRDRVYTCLSDDWGRFRTVDDAEQADLVLRIQEDVTQGPERTTTTSLPASVVCVKLGCATVGGGISTVTETPSQFDISLGLYDGGQTNHNLLYSIASTEIDPDDQPCGCISSRDPNCWAGGAINELWRRIDAAFVTFLVTIKGYRMEFQPVLTWPPRRDKHDRQMAVVHRGDHVRLLVQAKDRDYQISLATLDVKAVVYKRDTKALRKNRVSREGLVFPVRLGRNGPVGTVEFTADRAGTFRFECAEVGGGRPNGDAGTLIVQDQ